MNDRIAHLINDFCAKSANYSIPGIIQANIYSLEYLVNEWYKFAHEPTNYGENYHVYRENLLDNIHKTIVTLIEKISQCRLLSGDLVKIFNNVVVNYIDSVYHDELQINELSDMLGKMSIRINKSSELINLLSKLSVV
jgi:hypothetical protein